MRKLCLLSCVLFALPFFAQADEILRVDRAPFEPRLLGIVDFEATSASPFPGMRYEGRMPFRGIIADTYFLGQIPILRKHGDRTFALNYGNPSYPLEEANEWRSYSTLHVLEIGTHETNTVLTSRVAIPSIRPRDENVGFGAIALKFTNNQFVIGFDLRPLEDTSHATPIVQVTFLTSEGERIGEPVTLSEFGQYTFTTDDLSRDIKGIEFINLAHEAFAVDNIVFEVPILIG